MTRFISLMAGLVLALWVPMTMHCLLEQVSGLEILACETPVHEDEPVHPAAPCEGDGCASIESGDYALQVRDDRVDTAQSTFAWVELSAGASSTLETPSLFRRWVGDTPLEKEAQWQFILRAAPLARAPSCFTT